MAETPLPQTLEGETPMAEHDAGSPSPTRPRRSVSAFARYQGSRPPTGKILGEEQQAFVSTLRQCDVASELKGEEIVRVAGYISGQNQAARSIDVLDAYYAAGGRPMDAERRRATDRWFLYQASHKLNASQVVAQLCGVAPELGDVQLVRLGSEDGALVLRSGEHVCALEDDRPDGPDGRPTVSVRDVVRGFNSLLARSQVRMRLIGLAGDGAREAYFGQATMGAALTLLDGGYLCVDEAEALMDLCAW